MFVWLESLFIGSYIYHSDVIAGVELCYKSSEIIQMHVLTIHHLLYIQYSNTVVTVFLR